MKIGWAVPFERPNYVRTVKRLVIRWKDKKGKMNYVMLISTLSPRDVIRLTGQPISSVNNSRLVALAYAKFYDQRSGAVEIEIKEDKQGVRANKVKRIVLNKAALLARCWVEAFRTLLKPQHVAVRLNRV